MRIDGRWRRTIELADDRRSVIVIDQVKLPYELTWLQLANLADVARAIRDMHVRGAPLIGATAAYGLAMALAVDPSDTALDSACAQLAATRPTAINLRWALDEMRRAVAPLAQMARKELHVVQVAARGRVQRRIDVEPRHLHVTRIVAPRTSVQAGLVGDIGNGMRRLHRHAIGARM